MKEKKVSKAVLRKAARIWVATLLHTSADMPSSKSDDLSDEENGIVWDEIVRIMDKLNPDGMLFGNISDAIKAINNTKTPQP